MHSLYSVKIMIASLPVIEYDITHTQRKFSEREREREEGERGKKDNDFKFLM